MNKKSILTVLIWLWAFNVAAQKISISPEMRITRSTKFKKDIYKIDAPAGDPKGVITIEGNDIIIDFNYAELRGDASAKNPDEFTGIGILVQNSKNVTIKNLKARGYKIALIARNTERLTLENCDFSYNYRPHLNSTQEKEDISDWMSYHHNEKDEWLRYGAAMYLRGCNFFTIRDCKVTGGQNALMLMESNDGLIVNNDFSFNSGIGIGMYRSSRNRVIYNRIIFNVRGYSHGVYNRGQDSAGILVYEQSNSNIFYKNNVTHGGDGFFLWAGQTTMDTGEGGCNDNLLYGNDFSYAPTNGIEVTFSRNIITANIINECDHGIWGGYSFSTKITGNKFHGNRIGIAIEHGQHNEISDNIFSTDKEAIRLWANAKQDPSWGYAKNRDTRSSVYSILKNSFNENETGINIRKTDTVYVTGNNFSGVRKKYVIDSTTIGLDSSGVFYGLTTGIPSQPGVGKPILIPDPKYAGRKNIMITEWGPYDFKYPILWHTNPVDTSRVMAFKLLGPKGQWKIVSLRGVCCLSDATKTRNFPGEILFNKIPGEENDIEIVMEYKGASFVDQFGKRVPANKPYKFKFRKFFQPINWEVLFYRLDTTSYNPIRAGTLFSATEKKAPFRTEKVNKIDYAWWGGIKEAGIQYTQFITVASGTANIVKGKYELSVTWDDAVRVYVDDKLVLDEWTPSKYTFDESPHKKVIVELDGEHHFRVEHIELGGFATLALKIKPVE
ncbi:MAG TPA: right-handed parallel beta-helix repeat-containing protein [Chitinophagaceae bacterium]|nr:right-handed parallel beta-helix repeat-containing protein [Chitinophagaceae bacterium]